MEAGKTTGWRTGEALLLKLACKEDNAMTSTAFLQTIMEHHDVVRLRDRDRETIIGYSCRAAMACSEAIHASLGGAPQTF